MSFSNKFIWTPNKSSKFTVPSTYNSIVLNTNSLEPHPVWKALWKTKIHERYNVLFMKSDEKYFTCESELNQIYSSVRFILSPLC